MHATTLFLPLIPAFTVSNGTEGHQIKWPDRIVRWSTTGQYTYELLNQVMGGIHQELNGYVAGSDVHNPGYRLKKQARPTFPFVSWHWQAVLAGVVKQAWRVA